MKSEKYIGDYICILNNQPLLKGKTYQIYSIKTNKFDMIDIYNNNVLVCKRFLKFNEDTRSKYKINHQVYNMHKFFIKRDKWRNNQIDIILNSKQ